MSKKRVFVDTNIIIEAFRTSTWTAVCNRFSIETVDKCIEEALTGDPYDPTRTAVDQQALLAGLTAHHSVSDLEIAELALAVPSCQGLDDGELHLLAWLYSQKLLPDALVLISTADKAAIVATCKIGWTDSLTSLESLASLSGVTQGQINSLAGHYQKVWLDQIRQKILLGVIP